MSKRFIASSKVGKGDCPYCGTKGKGRFRYYIDTENGNHILSPYIGICDRQESCPVKIKGWWEWEGLKDYLKIYGNTKHDDENDEKIKKGIIKHIDKADIDRLSFSDDNTFVRFLQDLGISLKDIAKLFRIYNVRVWDKDNICFFYEDLSKRITSGKIMTYDRHGHRFGLPTSIHHLLRKDKTFDENDTAEKNHLFGLHLLSLPENRFKQVGIVESEKSSIVASYFYPDKVWLATGSLENFNKRILEQVSDRHIIVFPDAGTYDSIYEKIDEQKLLYRAKNLNVSNAFEQKIYGRGYDIADYIDFTYPKNDDMIDFHNILLNPKYLERFEGIDIQVKTTTNIKRIKYNGNSFYSRYYYSLTGISKEKRALIKIDGEELEEIDACSLHPRLLGVIFEETTGKRRPDFLNGDVHSNIALMLGIERAEAKDLNNSYWNKKIRQGKTIGDDSIQDFEKIIKRDYPDLMQFLITIKEVKNPIEQGNFSHTNLKVLMVDKEVRFMNDVIKTLDMPMIYIYDAIIVKKSSAEYAKTIFESILEKHLKTKTAAIAKIAAA